MSLFLYPQVRDAETGEIVTSLVGQQVQIVAMSTLDPVPITEYPSGIEVPDSRLTVGPNFALGSFNTTNDEMVVRAVSDGGAITVMWSPDGLMEDTAAAREAAVAAQVAAEAAALAAEPLPSGRQAGYVLTAGSTDPEDDTWAPASGGGGGDGTVTTINNIGPDGEGNVTLDYGQVGAAAASHEHAASATTSGEFNAARIPNLAASKIATGTLDVDRVPSLPATKITSGTLDPARLPTYVTSVNGDSGVVEVTCEDIEAVRNVTPDDLGGIGVVTELPTAGPGKRLFFLIPE